MALVYLASIYHPTRTSGKVVTLCYMIIVASVTCALNELLSDASAATLSDHCDTLALGRVKKEAHS